MSEEGIVFRSATAADADLATPLIYSSGPDVCEYILKDKKLGSAAQFIHFAFQKTGGELGYTNHVCALYQGKVVGIGAIWSGKNGIGFLLADIRKIITFYGFWKGIGVLLRGLKSEFLVRPPKKNEFALGHLGISNSLRGKGIGTALIRHLIDMTPLQAGEKIILDVSFINPKAQKLYEKLGFLVTGTRHSNLKRKALNIEVPHHYRMELRK